MNVDGGSNVQIFTNRNIFYKFKEYKCNLEHVRGSKILSTGYVLIITLNPVYHLPNNPQNTLITTAINNYNGYDKVTVSTLDSLSLPHHSGYKFSVKME